MTLEAVLCPKCRVWVDLRGTRTLKDHRCRKEAKP